MCWCTDSNALVGCRGQCVCVCVLTRTRPHEFCEAMAALDGCCQRLSVLHGEIRAMCSVVKQIQHYLCDFKHITGVIHSTKKLPRSTHTNLLKGPHSSSFGQLPQWLQQVYSHLDNPSALGSRQGSCEGLPGCLHLRNKTMMLQQPCCDLERLGLILYCQKIG